jgi:L-iditol 2-dehydrogenase
MAARMRAAVLHGREDIRIEQVDVPAIEDGEILLRTRVALTCGTDLKVYRRGYHARMIRPPAVFGHEVAGVVEQVGAGAEWLQPGTPVVAANSAPCGECHYCRIGTPSLCDDLLFWNGAYAEFVRIPARVVSRNLLTLDKGVGFREAAMVEPLACVLRGIEESGVTAGQTVAVIGAGPIGLMLVRLACLRGARVIAVGRNRRRLQKAQELGAEETISVQPGEDPAERLRRMGAHGHGPDVVIEAVGLPETAEAAVRAVRKGGLVNLFAGCPADTRIGIDAQRLHYQELTIRSTFHHTPESIRGAFRLIADGLVDPRAFITGEAPLEELPAVLERMARGGDDLKTAILTWGRE